MKRHQLASDIELTHDVISGLLFIPDISGFSELAHSTDVLTGRQITYELLSAIINKNTMQLTIGEVEGDAIFFYRHGNPPTLKELMHQYEEMNNAFDNKRKELEDTLGMKLNISLKIIAHYGSMAEYNIGPFKKLYGEVVIEAHRLLKNSIDSNSYLLVTDALLKQKSSKGLSELNENAIQSNKLCEVYGTTSNICFTYFDFEIQTSLPQVA